MKILIASDLHTDVNQTDNFTALKNRMKKADVTIFAGDIAGDYQNEMVFLNSLPTDSQVFVVGGNHLGYNYLYRPTPRLSNVLDGTKEFSINKLCNMYTDNIKYLENDVVYYKHNETEYAIFGGTMYSDFNLYGNPLLYQQVGERGLNDFRLVHTYDGENVRPVTTDDYIRWHKVFMNKLTELCTSYNGKIIVVSHFAPSKRSISEKYNGKWKDLNPCYASDLTEFIKSHSNIVCWIHGHMHDTFDYKVGSCRVVCCPYGYFGREQVIYPEYFKGKLITIN